MAAKYTAAGLPLHLQPPCSLCTQLIVQSDSCEKKRKEKKKNGKSGQLSLCSKTRRKHLKKLAATRLFLPLKHAGWRREGGGRLCYCAREKGNPTLREETSAECKSRFKPSFAALLGHIYKRWIPSHQFHFPALFRPTPWHSSLDASH